MAVNVKVDGTTYEGINTITTGGKTLELKSEGGAPDWQDLYIDPKEYYAEHRPATWPKIPLPSEMEDPENAEYAGGKTKFVMLYHKLPGDIFLTDRLELPGTNIAATIQKYADAETPVGSSETITLETSTSGEILNFEYTNEDADWSSYNYAVLTITADTLTQFNYTAQQRFLNGHPLNLSNWSSALVELSGSAPDLERVFLGSNVKTANNVEFFSLGKNAVTNMVSMFQSCSNMQTIPELDTSAVTNMQNMFSSCYNLQTIPALDTSAVTNMQSMFSSCYNLQTIPALNTSAVTNMQGVFSYCSSLQTIPALNTSAVTNMSSMFSSCSSLQTIPALDTSAVTNMQSMFSGCSSLQTIRELNTSAVTNMQGMFNGCSSLQTIPALDTSAVTNMQSMFSSCYSLQTIPALDTSAVTNMSSMFSSCSSLQTIPALDTGAVTSMQNMFNSCSSLQTISALNTSAVTNMQGMFYYCSSLQTIPALNTSAVTNMSSMFNGCSSLQTIDLSKWNFSSTNGSNSMFNQCYALNKFIVREFGAGTVIYVTPFTDAYRISGRTNATYNPTGAHDGYIYVPDADVETIKAATNWSTYASQIKGLSELPAA